MNDRSILFREDRLASLTLPNRFIRSATHDCLNQRGLRCGQPV